MIKDIRASIRFLFIVVLFLIYICFITLDITGGSVVYSNTLKFALIVLCFCYSLFSKSNSKSISFAVKAAMLFTVISDLFILILDYYLYGVITFIAVQLLYNYRISLFNARYSTAYERISFLRCKAVSYREGVLFTGWLIIQITVSSVILLLLHWQKVNIEPLLVASAFYFTGLLLNTIRAAFAARNKPKDSGMRLFFTGLFLFLLCDINVGLFNLSDFIPVSEEIYSYIYNISSVLMWFFYAPSQAIIALSIEKNR